MRRIRRSYGPRPLKQLGQHFLLDEEVASAIVAAMHLRWEERALEIGPGQGVLLRFLLKLCHKVTAIELDARLRKVLQKTFGGHPGLELVFGDFLRFDLNNYLLQENSAAKLVGNIPYSLSSPILLRIFEVVETLQKEANAQLESATLMLQRQVAERICADPGTRACGGITLLRSLVADAELLFDVSSEAFSPPPAVRSSVIQLRFYPNQRFAVPSLPRFKELIQHVFKQRRKMLKNSLAGLSWLGPGWRQMDFDLSRRPEALSLEDFIRLSCLSSLNAGSEGQKLIVN